MNSKIYFLCVCGCKRQGMDKNHFDIYNKGKHCEKCGEKYKLIPAPILGILVHSEGACQSYESEYVSMDELLDEMKK